MSIKKTVKRKVSRGVREHLDPEKLDIARARIKEILDNSEHIRCRKARSSQYVGLGRTIYYRTVDGIEGLARHCQQYLTDGEYKLKDHYMLTEAFGHPYVEGPLSLRQAVTENEIRKLKSPVRF